MPNIEGNCAAHVSQWVEIEPRPDRGRAQSRAAASPTKPAPPTTYPHVDERASTVKSTAK
jgi:hypothetical protein